MLEIKFSEFPNYTSELFHLRRISEKDCDALFILRTNKQVMQFLDKPIPKDKQEMLDLIQQIEFGFNHHQSINWVVAENKTDVLIGLIGIWKIDKENHRGEIGYTLLPEYQRKRIMDASLKFVIDFAFNGIQLHSLEANTNPLNVASKKILEKNGFNQEAYFRENYFYNGLFLDSAIFSLVHKK